MGMIFINYFGGRLDPGLDASCGCPEPGWERGIPIMTGKAHGWLISTDDKLKNTPSDALIKKLPI